MTKLIRDSMDRHDSFRLLSANEKDGLAELAVSLDLEPNTVFVEVNQPLPGFVCVENGMIELMMAAKDGTSMRVDTLHAGSVLGRPIPDQKSSSKSSFQTSDKPTRIQLLDGATVETYLGDHKKTRERIEQAHEIQTIVTFLKNSESLRGIPFEELWEIATKTKRVALKTGDRLIRQGAEEDTVYIVHTGRMTVTRDEAPSVRLVVLRAGDIVGEIAVLQRTSRTANVDAIEDVTCYAIEGGIFREVTERHGAFNTGIEKMMAERLHKVEEEALETAGESAETGTVLPSTQARDISQKPVAAETATVSATDESPSTSRSFIPNSAARRGAKAAPTYMEPPQLTLKQKIIKLIFVLPDYPTIRQHSQMDCSAACLATVCKYFGKTISLNVTRDMARVRQEGASMANVIRAANELGFETEAYISSIDQLREKKLPAIANWKGYHWIVVYEVTDTHVIVSDPADGMVKHSIDDFIESWSRYTIFMKPTQKFAAFPESKPSLMVFMPFFEKHKRTILEIFAASVFLQILAIVAPLFSKFVIDEIILKADAQWLTMALVVMVIVMLLNMFMDYVSDIMALNMTLGINYDLISATYRKLLRLPLSYYEARQVGDITNRLEQHEEITQFITEDGLDTFINLMTAVAFLCVMIYLNGWLALGAVSVLFLNIVIVRIISPRMRQLDQEQFVKEAASESHTIESIRGAMTLKTLAADHHARWKYEDHFAALTNLSFKEAKLGQVAEIFSGVIDSLSDIVVLFLGGLFVINGDLTIGGLIAFTVLANGLQDPINTLIGKWDEIQELLVAIEKLNDVLEKDTEYDPEYDREHKIELPNIRGHVQFQNVTFRYDDDDPNNVVQAINLTIEPGQKVAFVGPSGCGKSTLLKMFFGFFQPREGRMRIDGFDYRDIALPSLRRQIAMVPQESLIFKGTVRDNIGMARKGASLEDITTAAKKADAHDFISTMAGGYDAVLEEQGSNLSGGQRQRINLARAFLRDAPVLVMDEATSALDVETERFIMDNIMSEYADRTVIMIAHRLSTVRKADLIVVLNDGLIVEQGTHDELIEAQGFYYHLSSRQMSVE